MAVAYCNTTAILDAVMLESTDNSAAQRLKCLAWLNQTIRDVLNQPRKWSFLGTVSTLAVTANRITLPNGVADISYLILGKTFYDKGNQISDEEALSEAAVGYTLSPDGVITFYPATTETSCSVKHEANLATKYTDAATATIFPIEFENVLLSGTLMRCFKTDKDGRFAAESQLFQYQMGLVKEWDNRQKPTPQIDNHAYIRVTKTSMVA